MHNSGKTEDLYTGEVAESRGNFYWDLTTTVILTPTSFFFFFVVFLLLSNSLIYSAHPHYSSILLTFTTTLHYSYTTLYCTGDPAHLVRLADMR